MKKLIKIYGERNTNTNYFSKLIEQNLNAEELSSVVPIYINKLQKVVFGNEWVRDLYFDFTYGNNLGWKHTCVKSAKELNKYKILNNNDISFITITKNPYSWLMSLYRNPYHQYYKHKLDFETFLVTPWKTTSRDNCGKDLKSPIELWNMKNSSYLQLSALNGLNITTESIFENPEAVVNKISSHFNISKKSNEFVNYEKSTKNSTKDSNYYRNYYVNELWRDELSNEAIAIINKSIDKELMNHFGYEVLEVNNEYKS